MTSKYSVHLIATSAGKKGDMDTGVWLEELVDSCFLQPQFFTEAAKRFMLDHEAAMRLSVLFHFSQRHQWSKLQLCFLCGGHGTCVDFIDNPDLNKVLNENCNSRKILAAVCHGTNALATFKTPDGTHLVKDKN